LCRSFLTPDPVNHKYYGRYNLGVVTLNLVDIALSSQGDFDLFWELFNERAELCHKAHKERIAHLSDTLADEAPIMWMDGALARLEHNEKIEQLFYNNVATASLGYAGLYECVRYMTGCSHMDGNKGQEFGLQVMKALNAKCAEWRKAENISYSLYGTPMETGVHKFAKALQRRFGIIDGITDRDYITNSYHYWVKEEVDPFTKLTKEAEYQALSPGGAISYVESCDVTNNLDALMSIVKHIYNTIMYAEINTKSDACMVCGYQGEIKIIDKDGKLDWQCPNCGNTDHRLMVVRRRVCGYISSNFFNQGRTQEINERYVHLDNHEAL